MTDSKEPSSGMGVAWWSEGLSIMKRTALFISTAAGAGEAPFAPGTFGSLAGLFLFLFLGRLSYEVQLGVFFATLAIAWWAVGEAEKIYGTHDASHIVVDEVLGIWITLIGLPMTWGWLLAGFLLFRLLDILKPFPAYWIDQKVKGATGVILDDVVSAIYAQALLQVVWQSWGAR